MSFPSEFIVSDITAGNCRLIGTSGLTGYSCSITNNKLIITNPFGTVSSLGNDRVKFTIANNYI